ncbi:hypothetical protein BGW42_007098, partial [Actinomortierella wolfii]
KTPTEAMCMVECQVNVFAALRYNATYGTIVTVGVNTGYNTTLAFDSNGTGSINAVGVNIAQTVYKGNTDGLVFSAQPGQVLTADSNLNHPEGFAWNSLGAREDGVFLIASRNSTDIYFFPANTTQPPIAVSYTNLPGNAVEFCGEPLDCHADFALDGNGYLWVITSGGHVYISTTPQTTAIGGQLKYIGTVPLDQGYFAGLAFDTQGNIYYSGQLPGNVGFIYKAPMEDPMNGSVVYQGGPYIIDLATCAYPRNDISHLLA